MEIVERQFDRCCPDVLVQPMQLRRAWDGNNPRLLGQQPGERNLSRCGFLLFCEPAKQINQTLVRFSSLWREARDDVTEIAFIELRTCIDLARQEALAKRAKWDKPDVDRTDQWPRL